MELESLERALAWALVGWSLVATGVTCAVVVRARRVVGRRLHAERGGGALRTAVGLGLCAAVVILALGDPGRLSTETLAPLAVALVLGGVCARVAPHEEDSVLGTQGVRRGWLARRFEELEGWRLEGAHLRFRARGELLAVVVPEPEQSALRARLESVAAAARDPLDSGDSGAVERDAPVR